MTPETAILNLVHRYAEMMDDGRFEALADELFRHAEFVVAPPPAPRLDGPAMTALICRTTIRYPEGRPRTKHLITNPIVEVHEADGTATCRSYYTVVQRTSTQPLVPIVSGRYHDRFARIDGRWWFTERDYTLVDMVGDVSEHIRLDPATLGTQP